jgi:hypothetical protein
MSSETPGAGLARLKVQHPAWQISRIVLGGTRPGFVAIKPDGGKPLTADPPARWSPSYSTSGGSGDRNPAGAARA